MDENPNSFQLILNGERIGYVDSEVKDIKNLLKAGCDIEEIVDILYPKYKQEDKI
ncbi:MAG: hypothetical protein Q4P30_01210 [Eubacteriales bacterium]|nr:hypothetical protein [Eubacteriales bacterium]